MKQGILIAVAILIAAYAVYTLALKPAETEPGRPNDTQQVVDNDDGAPPPDNVAVDLPTGSDLTLEPVPGSDLGRFDMAFNLRFDRPEGVGRVAINRSPDGRAGYLLDFSPEGVSLTRMQGGAGQPLAAKKAPLFKPGSKHEVVIKRRRLQTTVLVDDRIVLRHEDDALNAGDVATGVTPGKAQISNVSLVAVNDIYEQDDFMRDPSREQGKWTPVTGTWSVAIPAYAIRSANAFRYNAEGERCLSVMGESWWDDYLVQASFVAPEAGATGLAFYYRNENNYYLLKWDSRESESPALELIRVLDGKREVLDSQPVGYLPNQWYRMRVKVLGDLIEVDISGNEVFEIRDPYLRGGRVGLYAEAATDCIFDDVYVRGSRSFDGSIAADLDAWTSIVEGPWQADAAAHRLAGRPDGGRARLVRGTSSWKNYVVSVDVTPAEDGLTGLSVAYRTPIDQYQVEIDTRNDPARIALVRLKGGRREELDAIEMTAVPETLPLTVRMVDRYLGVLQDGQTILEAYDETLRGGAVSLFCEGGLQATFEDLSVHFPDEEPPRLTQSVAFNKEMTMEAWNSDWESVSPPSGLSDAWIHKQDFIGDQTVVTAKVTRLESGDGVGLALGCQGSSMENAYRMVLRGGDRWTVDLVRAGKTVKTFEVPSHVQAASEPRLKGVTVDLSQQYTKEQLQALIDAGESTTRTVVPGFDIRFERIGKGMLLGFLGEECVANWRDPDPLSGPRPGLFTVGKGRLDIDTTSVINPLVVNHDFRKAPVDWRSQKGKWLVTNRWECDPRWTFFAGHCLREDFNKDPLLAIWHKRAFGGDISVDFYVGPMMLRNTLGDYGKYVRDFNVTICADGKDISSGYSFQFGAENNESTRILRGDKVVAENPKMDIQTKGIHRRWFHVKARKRGDEIEMFVDGKKVLSYTDPEPLEGKRIAIWSWNSAIMVSRVRIIAERTGAMEPLGFEPSEICHCVYTDQPIEDKVKFRRKGPIRPDEND